jgi:tellurite resistance protein TerC
MGLHDIVKIPTTLSLAVIVTILAVAIIASFQVTKAKNEKDEVQSK